MPVHPRAFFYCAGRLAWKRGPVNINDQRHRGKLREDVEIARRSLQKFRDMRRALVHDYAGDLWTDGLPDYNGRRPVRVVIDAMSRAVSAYVMKLAGNRPRARVTSDYRSLNAFAIKYGVFLNQHLAKIRIEKAIQAAVTEAMFSMGIIRVGMLPAGFGLYSEPGVENISFDDWFHDTRAKCDERMRFMGHTYEAYLSDLKEDGTLDQSQVRKLVPSRRPGDEIVEQEPVKDLEAGREWDDYDDTVVLCDIWLPKEQQLVTMDSRLERVLKVVEWEGPARGPYVFLRFQRVPDSIIGLPGTYGLKPMFELINSNWRKLSRQAKNQKRVAIVNEKNAAFADRIKRSSDGEVVVAADPNGIGEYASPGIDGNLAQFTIQAEDQFNRSSGNAEHMAGLGPSAGTYGQEKIIEENVSSRLAEMSSAVAEFTRQIMQDVGRHLWDDEMYTAEGTLPIRQKVGGESVELQVPSEWMPEDRVGDYWQYNFEIVPYSMTYKTPSQQAGELMGMMSGVIMPALPYMEAQGLTVDWNAFVESMARLSNLPELRESLIPAQPPANEKPGPTDGPGKPPVTNRTYTRNSVPTGGTPQARRNAAAATYDGSATPQEKNLVSMPG